MKLLQIFEVSYLAQRAHTWLSEQIKSMNYLFIQSFNDNINVCITNIITIFIKILSFNHYKNMIKIANYF